MLALIIFIILNALQVVGIEYLSLALKSNSRLLTQEHKNIIKKYYLFDIFIIIFTAFSVFLFLILLNLYPIRLNSVVDQIIFSMTASLIYIINYKGFKTILKMFIYE